MLAVHDEEMFAVFCVTFAVCFVTWMIRGSRIRQQRLATIDRVLAAPSLDEATRRQLLESLSAGDMRRSAWRQALGQQFLWLGRNLLFVAGWMMMFTGGGMWLYCAAVHEDRFTQANGFLIGVIGLGLVTLPLALRELEARRVGR